MEQAVTAAQETTAPAATGGINWIDAVVLTVLLVSGIFALMRGFVKEAFVLLSWIAATVATIKLYPILQPWMKTQVESETWANAITVLLLFCGTLVALLPFTSYVIDKVKGTALSTLDRSMGFVFGVARGMLIVCLLYLVAQQFFWESEKDVPKAIKVAHTRPMLETGAEIIDEMIPEKKKKQLAQDVEEATDREKRVNDAQRILRDLALPSQDSNKNNPAYDDKARQDLNKLIDEKSKE